MKRVFFMIHQFEPTHRGVGRDEGPQAGSDVRMPTTMAVSSADGAMLGSHSEFS